MILPLWAAIMDQVLWPGRGRVMAGIWDCRYGRGTTGGWGTTTYFGLEVDGCSAPCINCTHNHAHTYTHTHTPGTKNTCTYAQSQAYTHTLPYLNQKRIKRSNPGIVCQNRVLLG